MNKKFDDKYCKGCDEILPIIDFHKNGKSTHPKCKICRQTERKATRYARKEGTKYCTYCTYCTLTLPVEEFHSDASQSDGLNLSCKECREKQRILSENKYDVKIPKNKWNMSIDRVDSDKGYIPNNIQLVCSIVNKMKGDLRDNKFLLICHKIYRTKIREIDQTILDFACSF